MNVQASLLLIAGSYSLCCGMQSSAALVLPELDGLHYKGSSTLGIGMPARNESNTSTSGVLPVRPQTPEPKKAWAYLPLSSVPYRQYPYTPTAHPSPWNRDSLTHRIPSHVGLPEAPTATANWGLRSPFERQSHGATSAPYYTSPAYPAPQGPVTKPFADYQPDPPLSPYIYILRGDTLDVLEHYFYARPWPDQETP